MALLIKIQRRERKGSGSSMREHSMELWHTDWAKLDKWFIAYLDDASRFVVGYGLFDSPTSENALKVLDDAVFRYGKPDYILTDRGPQFYANAIVKEKGLTIFEEHLNELGIKHIVGRVSHPQTNGKIERFYGTVKDKIDEFSSVDELIAYYNSIRPHMSLNTQILEIPEEAFCRKLDIEGDHGK